MTFNTTIEIQSISNRWQGRVDVLAGNVAQEMRSWDLCFL